MDPTVVSSSPLSWPGLSLVIICQVLVSLEVRKITCGDSEGAVKLLSEFLKVTEIPDGIISGVYQAILGGRVISYMGMGGRFKYVIPQSTGKGSLKQS